MVGMNDLLIMMEFTQLAKEDLDWEEGDLNGDGSLILYWTYR